MKQSSSSRHKLTLLRTLNKPAKIFLQMLSLNLSLKNHEPYGKQQIVKKNNFLVTIAHEDL